MTSVLITDVLDVSSLFQTIVDIHSIYNESKVYFDLFSELIMLMPSTVDTILKRNGPVSEIKVLTVSLFPMLMLLNRF